MGPPNMRVQRTRFASLRSPLTRGPLGSRNRLRLGITVGIVAVACATRESAAVKVTDLHGMVMPGVEVRTDGVSAGTDTFGVATFRSLTPGPHSFDAHLRGFKSCQPVTLIVSNGGSPAEGTITMRLLPGQGWVDGQGRAVTPTAENLASEAAEAAAPCPE
jgi:hypothetical protein